MQKNIEVSPYVSDLLSRMDEAQKQGQLAIFLRNLVVEKSTFSSENIFTDFMVKFGVHLHDKLKNKKGLTNNEKLMFALLNEEINSNDS